MPLMARLQDNAVSNGSGGILDVSGYTSVGIQITGLNGSNGTVSFEGTINGTDWVAFDVLPAIAGDAVSNVNNSGAWIAPVAGFRFIRTPLTDFSGVTGINVFTFASEASIDDAGGGGGGVSSGTVTQGPAGTVPWLVKPEQPVSNGGSPTRVAANTTAVPLKGAQGNRSQFALENVSTAILYIQYGVAPVITGGSEHFDALIPANTRYEEPQPVDNRECFGIWSAINGYVMVSEKTST
jgi:hypothetical protein